MYSDWFSSSSSAHLEKLVKAKDTNSEKKAEIERLLPQVDSARTPAVHTSYRLFLPDEYQLDRQYESSRHAASDSTVQDEITGDQQWSLRAYCIQSDVCHLHRSHWSIERVGDLLFNELHRSYWLFDSATFVRKPLKVSSLTSSACWNSIRVEFPSLLRRSAIHFETKSHPDLAWFGFGTQSDRRLSLDIAPCFFQRVHHGWDRTLRRSNR